MINHRPVALLIRGILFAVVSLAAFGARAAEKPNIVLIFMDNFDWGEIGAYGSGVLRRGRTPQIDSLADEGLQLLNFNVDAQ